MWTKRSNCAKFGQKTQLQIEKVQKMVIKSMKNAYIAGKQVNFMQKTVKKTAQNAYIGGIQGQLRTLFGPKNAYMGKIMGQKSA